MQSVNRYDSFVILETAEKKGLARYRNTRPYPAETPTSSAVRAFMAESAVYMGKQPSSASVATSGRFRRSATGPKILIPGHTSGRNLH